MTQLRDRLQEALGSQYQIERELGGGGMSRVFVAVEAQLGRRVVVKVLPPDLSAGLSVERFRREIQVIAALQHPHIVPLLASGEAGELLYYTMPFIEGESLRAKLDREGAQPVASVVRILREVTDALGYAHQNGVVHRDIKPDNILLSHQHAVVTDFGIGKALSEAGAAARITSTGVAIGTPAYMAPEQAAADPRIDHRADIYAVGVLAYELLAGEPPYRGPTAQAILAAKLTRPPAPITDLRAAVPAPLAALVMHCLERDPADRFQSTAELRAELDQFSSPTSATTPAAGTAPAGVERPWSLPLVLGYFLATGAAVLGLAWGLRNLLGLPDWFISAAVVLLALGLPVVVLAVITHNRRIAGRKAVSLPIPGNVHHRLTMAKAVTGGIASFSALALVTGGYMAMRLLGIGPVGSLVASGKLAARERLIIADFGNQTRDPLLGPAVTQAFRVDFSQSKLVSPVEADYVRRVLKRMQRPDSIPVGLTVAREIAQREGWKAVVAGELQQVGPNVLVSAQLVNAQSGEVLASVRETARDSTGILEAVDRVSKRLREKIGESLRSIRANPPLADVTTGSLDALRNYSEALRDVYEGDNAKAVTLLQEAVHQDSSFAMAWRKLGTMLVQGGERSAEGVAALTRAFQLRDRLTFRERKLTEDSYYMDVTGATDSATGALQSLLAEYPNDSWALNNLGVMYEVVGNKVAAEQSYLSAAKLEPESALIWGNVFSVRVGLARYDSAASTLKLLKERFAPGALMDEREVTLLAGRRDFAAAEARTRELVERYRSDPRAHNRELHLLAGILGIRGKLAEADRTFVQASELFAGRGLAGNALAEQALRVSPVAMYGDRRAAAARLDEALRASPLERMSERDRPLMDLIVAAVVAGQQDRARALLAEFERNPGNTPGRVVSILRIGARARVLGMANEALPQALADYRRASGAACGYCNDAPMANAFDRAGMPDSALFYYQRWADAGEWLWDAGIYNFWPPVAYFRLAELYQQKSDTARAMEFYGKFAELWKEADAELQPRVKEARRRMSELTAEPRR